MRLVESYGTGIRRIFKLYESCAVLPTIEASASAFKIVLPNMNAASAPLQITSQMREVLAYIKSNGSMTDAEIAALLDIKRTRVYTLTRDMKALGLIRSEGRGSGKVYFAF